LTCCCCWFVVDFVTVVVGLVVVGLPTLLVVVVVTCCVVVVVCWVRNVGLVTLTLRWFGRVGLLIALDALLLIVVAVVWLDVVAFIADV